MAGGTWKSERGGGGRGKGPRGLGEVFWKEEAGVSPESQSLRSSTEAGVTDRGAVGCGGRGLERVGQRMGADG